MPDHVISLRSSKMVKISKRFRGNKKKGKFKRLMPKRFGVQGKERSVSRRQRDANVENDGLFSKRLF